MTNGSATMGAVTTGEPRARTTSARWRVAAFSLVALCIGAAHVPAAVPSGNQYTYFLHGLARSGFGFLRDDWLAQTPDPFPIYSAIVTFSWRYLGLGAFYVWYLAAAAVFGCALLGIASRVWRGRSGVFAWMGLATSLVVLNWQVPSFIAPHLWAPVVVSFNGLAGQTALDTHFQPSTFAVVLLAGLWSVLAGRTRLGLLLIAITPLLHIDYGFAAAIFIGAVLWGEARRGGWAHACRAAIVPGVLLATAAGLAWWTFHPTSAATFKQASDILFTYRIPHHAQVSEWLNRSAVFQIALVAMAMVLVRSTPVAPLFTSAVVVTVALTLLQIVTGSEALALLFPWRTSVFLVPIASAVILAWLAAAIEARVPAVVQAPTAVAAVCIAAAVAVAVDGAVVARGFITGDAPAWRAVDTEVRAHLRAGQIFIVPLDFESFRDVTGAPVVIDGKSHPLRDFEIIAWFDRVRAVDRVYSADSADPCAAAAAVVREYGATDLVWPASRPWSCAGSERVYADSDFAWYRLSPPGR